MDEAAGARDAGTEAYFDSRTPEYDTASRFAPAAERIRRRAREGSTLVDVGCGTGPACAAWPAST